MRRYSIELWKYTYPALVCYLGYLTPTPDLVIAPKNSVSADPFHLLDLISRTLLKYSAQRVTEALTQR